MYISIFEYLTLSLSYKWRQRGSSVTVTKKEDKLTNEEHDFCFLYDDCTILVFCFKNTLKLFTIMFTGLNELSSHSNTYIIISTLVFI